MTADRARVLIVDDSPTMRGVISAMLSRDPEIEIVGQAGDANEARAAIKSLDPDVITLDVEMPNMNGLEFLERIMRLRPMPVVMVSTLTQRGADLALAALELGAVECVGKPIGGDTGYGFANLPGIVKAAARARVRPRGPVSRPDTAVKPYRPSGRILAIGSSTGGVEALVELLGAFPENCPPTLIAQHMPASFTRSFAERLDRMCAPHVSEAEDGAPVEPGRIYIAPGATHHLELSGSKHRICRLSTAEPVNGHRPSVDVLFMSIAALGSSAVGLILTGMGRDGARGLKAMRDAGASTFGQDEASCVVYGMPKAAFELGAVEVQLPLSKLSGAVLAACSGGKQEKEQCLQHQDSKF